MKKIYEKVARKIVLLSLVVLISIISKGAIYYVSNAGNDSNSGLTVSLPWKSLNKVNISTFASGDQILFQRGNIFIGSLAVQRSGLTYGAYGTGINPVISGFETISGWTDQGGGVYRAKTTATSSCNMVTVNGVNTPRGRYPDSGWLSFESFVGRTSITDAQLTSTPNWNGAEVVIKKNNWTIDRSLITNHTNSTITYTSGSTNNPVSVYGNYSYFIQNHLGTLTTLGEWFCDGTYLYMYFGANSPNNYIVKASIIDNVITIDSKNTITVSDLTVEGGNDYGVYVNLSANISLSNCDIQFNGNTGIFGNSNTTFTIDGCMINNNNGDGVYITSTSTTLKNSTVDSSGMFPGMGASDGRSYRGVYIRSAGGLVEYNTISNSGYNGLMFYNDNFIVRYNKIDGFCNLIGDGAGIYTFDGDPSTSNTGQKVYNNIVMNGGANGLYNDNSANNIEWYNNTVINVSKNGIHMNDPYSNNVHDNIFYNCSWSGISIQNLYLNGGYAHDNTISSNTTVTGTTSLRLYKLSDARTYTVGNFGISNNNKFVVESSNLSLFTKEVVQPSYSLVNNTFSEWKTLSGQEGNSTLITAIFSEIQIPYNESKSAKTFTLSQPMIDVKGTKYAGSIILQPFTSIVLMKDLTIAVAPGAPTSVVASAGNASALVSFVAPVNNGGSVITGYTVTSIPVGGTDLNAGSTSLTHTISGLTNGTSYTFTVKATNSAGSSVASAASNSVIPSAPAATAFTFTGPTSGNVKSASANFTVTPNNLYTGTITITPTGTGSTGLTEKVLTFSNSSSAQTFTITPTVAGSITLTPTNSGILTNPAILTYTANAVAPAAPTSVVATAGNANATVSFVAPTNNGGSAITGYTVTSIPAGGTDLNAGSTSLTHTISGLTNGISYTFTVKATNSAGSSVASAASNSVIPSAPIDNVAPIISAFSIPATSNSLTVSISSFTVTDNTGVTGYLLTETSSIPSSGATGWTASKPSSYTFIATGLNTLYAWAKDEIGNVSASLNQVVTITLDAVPVVEYTQTLELKKGYNMISTYVIPSDSVVSDVIQPIVADGNLIKIQDESGNSYENWGSFGGWINNLGSIQKTEGYKIKVADNCTLQVTGRQVILPMDIPLNAGWNIISYPRTDALDAMMIVQSLIDQNKLIKVQDEVGNSIEDWGIYGGWKNGIGNFIPGKAYRVKMSASAVLTIQENYPKSANLPVYAEKTSYFSSQAEGNGVDHMNINLVGLKESGLSVGDELAAFDGDVCVGTLKITNSNLNIGSASLIASSTTSSQLKDGFKDGISVQLYVWNEMSGLESKVEAVAIKGSLNYNKNSSILVKMKSLTTSVATQNAGMIQAEVYPNPSQGRFIVRFSELPEAGSRIEILDLSGRKVASRLITGISEELNLDGQAAGLYLVKSILGSREQIQKLVIQ